MEEIIIKLLIQLSHSALDYIIIYIMCSALLKEKLKPTLKIIIFLLIAIVLSALINLFVTYTSVIYILTYIIWVISIRIIFKKNFSDSFILYIVSYILCCGIQLLIFAFLKPAKETLTSNIITCIASFATIAACLVIYRFVPVNKLYQMISNKSLVIKLVIINVFVLILGISLLSHNSSDVFLECFPVYFISLTLLVISFISIYNSQKEIVVKEKQLEMSKQYLPIVDDLITHVMIKQHDFDNHMQTIKMLPASCHDYESLTKELAGYTNYMQDYNSASSLLKLNLKLVAGFLFSKCKLADDIGRSFKIEILNYNISTQISEYELIDVIGILIDNSFEATNPNDSITLSIDSFDNKISIKTINPGEPISPKQKAEMFSKGYSTKKNNSDKPIRGIGLYKLKTIVDSYSGKIYVDDILIKQEPYISINVVI